MWPSRIIPRFCTSRPGVRAAPPSRLLSSEDAFNTRRWAKTSLSFRKDEGKPGRFCPQRGSRCGNRTRRRGARSGGHQWSAKRSSRFSLGGCVGTHSRPVLLPGGQPFWPNGFLGTAAIWKRNRPPWYHTIIRPVQKHRVPSTTPP